MHIPDELADILFSTLEPGEKIKLAGVKGTLSKSRPALRTTAAVVLLIVFIGACLKTNWLLAMSTLCFAIMYVHFRLRRKIQEIFALTDRRLLKITAEGALLIAKNEEIEHISNSVVHFKGDLSPLRLVVFPDGYLTAMEITTT